MNDYSIHFSLIRLLFVLVVSIHLVVLSRPKSESLLLLLLLMSVAGWDNAHHFHVGINASLQWRLTREKETFRWVIPRGLQYNKWICCECFLGRRECADANPKVILRAGQTENDLLVGRILRNWVLVIQVFVAYIPSHSFCFVLPRLRNIQLLIWDSLDKKKIVAWYSSVCPSCLAMPRHLEFAQMSHQLPWTGTARALYRAALLCWRRQQQQTRLVYPLFLSLIYTVKHVQRRGWNIEVLLGILHCGSIIYSEFNVCTFICLL